MVTVDAEVTSEDNPGPEGVMPTCGLITSLS